MALTATQRAEVRRYLGYADTTQGFFSTLEGALDVLSAEAQTQIVALLADLTTIETTLRSSWGRQKVIRAEEVTLAGGDEVRVLRMEGKRLVGHLATILGTRIVRTPFDGEATSGVAQRG